MKTKVVRLKWISQAIPWLIVLTMIFSILSLFPVAAYADPQSDSITEINVPQNSSIDPLNMWHAKTLNDFGVDPSKINLEKLKANAMNEIAKLIIVNTVPFPIGMALQAFNWGEVGMNLWLAGKGLAEPDIIMPYFPQFVMAWDVIKGPRNMPINFTLPINSYNDDGALKKQIQGFQTIRKEFSTTAFGTFGHYGYDPFTDTIKTTTTMHTIQTETFNGSEFNKTFSMSQLSIPKIDFPKIDLQPYVQLWKPYVPLPKIDPLQSFNVPRISIPQLYVRPYVPPRIIMPPRISLPQNFSMSNFD